MAFDLGAGSLAQNPGKSDLAQKYMQSRGFQSEGLYSKSFLQLCQLTWWIVLRFPVTVMQSVVINHRKVMQLIANNCFNHLPHSFLGFVFFFFANKDRWIRFVVSELSFMEAEASDRDTSLRCLLWCTCGHSVKQSSISLLRSPG